MSPAIHSSYIRAIVLLACLLACLPAFSESTPFFQNGLLAVEFESGHGAIEHFIDQKNGHEFAVPSTGGDLWKIDLYPPSEGNVSPGQAKSFTWRADEQRPGELMLVWQKFSLDKAPLLRVTVTVTLDDREPVSRWQIAVEGMGELKTSAIRFPRFPAISAQDNEVLAVPMWMGERTTRTRELLAEAGKTGRFEWEYPGLLSLQCMAFYRENGPGLYVACDDTTALGKRFAVIGNEQKQAGVELVQLPENRVESQGDYHSPYRVVLGTFEGDWITAATRYREWALQQWWAKESRLKKTESADWVTKTGLWIWNRGRSENVLAPATALQEKAELPVSVFWHWWHGCAYDTGFPEYLPPREGEETFRSAVEQAHQAGLHAIVYMNQRLWGMNSKSWTDENASQYAVKGTDGTIRPEIYNTFNKAPCASMCMGTPFWRGKYAGLAEQAVLGLGVDGIYMDQACSSLACYDPTHGHPLGGGTYWIEGFRTLQADIRERCNRDMRRVTLAGEGCGEAWLPYLDLMLSLQVSMERYARPGAWEPIPFFHAVYHGYGIFYGNYSSLTMPPYDELWPAEFAPKEPLKLLDRAFSRQFRMEQARAFVWGQQPAIANFRPNQITERSGEIDYVVRLAKLRNLAPQYFLHGTFLRPPEIHPQMEKIDMSRLSIYAGQQDALKRFEGTYPSVLAGAWLSSDRNVGIALTTISDETREVKFAVSRREYPIPVEGRVRITDENGSRILTRYTDGRAEITILLAPFGACLVEIEKN